MPPVSKKSRGFLSTKKKKLRMNDGLRRWIEQQKFFRSNGGKNEIVTKSGKDSNIVTHHNDHSYYKSVEHEETNKPEALNLDESLNSLGIVFTTTPYLASDAQRPNMDGIPYARDNSLNQKSGEELHHDEDIIASPDMYYDGVPTPYCVTGHRVVDFDSFLN